MWSDSASICAACSAAASGDSTELQPRPANASRLPSSPNNRPKFRASCHVHDVICSRYEVTPMVTNPTAGQVKYAPDGRRMEDQMSCAPQSGFTGGQLMTGHVALPDSTGPKPLLRPATATNTVGMPWPAEIQNNQGSEPCSQLHSTKSRKRLHAGWFGN